MKQSLGLAMFLVCLRAWAESCPSHQPRAEATLVQVEQTWAKAKVRFTDIFVYRDGRWMAVAGQESLVAGMAK